MTRHALQPVVAIDGPAASGKSSTAKEVAAVLGWAHLDSGALYRALTLVAIELDPSAEGPADVILAAAEARGLSLKHMADEYVPWIDGAVAEGIRSSAVTAKVSPVSAMPALRAWVNARLRAVVAAGERPVVMDGRDIGTAVFPDAAVKVYLTAGPEVRAKRRLLQGGRRPDPSDLVQETLRLSARDAADAGRAVAPLRKAADAVELDTSDLGFAEQVARIVALVEASPLSGHRSSR